MGTPYLAHAQLVARLRSTLPIRLQLYCPFTKQVLNVERENLIAEMVVDTANMGAESQLAPGFFLELARFQRAAEYAAELAKSEYVQWKAERAKEFRLSNPAAAETAKPKRGKKDAPAPAADPNAAPVAAARKAPTAAEVEAYYRGHPDYMRMNTQEQLMRAYAGIFDDAKEGARMKLQILKEQQSNMRGYERAERTVAPIEERRFEVPPFQGPPGAGAPPQQHGAPPGYQPPPPQTHTPQQGQYGAQQLLHNQNNPGLPPMPPGMR